MSDEKEEVQKGFYVEEVPSTFGRVIAKDGKPIDVLELLAEIANKIERAGLK